MSEPCIMWRTSGYNSEIVPYKVIQSSTNLVTYEYKNWEGKTSTRREHKSSTNHAWYESFEEATEFVLSDLNSRIIYAKETIAKLEADKAELLARKPPAIPT